MYKRLKLVGGITLAFVLVLVLATLWPRPGSAAAGETERQVQVPIGLKKDPVVITKVTLGDAVVQAGRFVQAGPAEPITPFRAGDDWIQNLAVYLYNRTNKTIVFARVIFGFPETGDAHSQPQRAFILELGLVPQSAPVGTRMNLSDLQPIVFPPGQTMVIRLGDYIDRIRSRVEPPSPRSGAIPLAAATQLAIFLNAFFFADGMEYHAGVYNVQDPQDPGKVVHMDQGYFPGDPERTWPGRPDWRGPAGGREMR
jgi:hypothetical protein